MNHAIGIGIINISVTPCAVNDGIFTARRREATQSAVLPRHVVCLSNVEVSWWSNLFFDNNFMVSLGVRFPYITEMRQDSTKVTIEVQ